MQVVAQVRDTPLLAFANGCPDIPVFVPHVVEHQNAGLGWLSFFVALSLSRSALGPFLVKCCRDLERFRRIGVVPADTENLDLSGDNAIL